MDPGRGFLERLEALESGHFILDSGRHSVTFIRKERFSLYPEVIEDLSYRLAWKVSSERIEIVCGPALGGALLSQCVASALADLHRRFIVSASPAFVFSEEVIVGPDGRRASYFRNVFSGLLTGKRVLVVDDVLTTGGTIRRTIDAILKRENGIPVGAAVIVNRGGVRAEDLGIPFLVSLYDVPLDSFAKEECPVCNPTANRNVLS